MDLESVEIDEARLMEACEEYPRIEQRARFYDFAVEIADDYPLQAAIIILAVWNVARLLNRINA